MNTTTIYRLSIALSIILTIAAFVTLVAWIVSLVMGTASSSAASIIPWKTLLLLAVTALNCTLRARLIVRKRGSSSSTSSQTTS